MNDHDIILRQPAERPRRSRAVGKVASLLAAGIAVAALAGQVAASDSKVVKKGKASQTTPELATQHSAVPVSPAPAASPPTASPPVHTEATTYDQWTVVCQGRPDASTSHACSAVLKVVDPSRKQVVFAWVLTRAPDGRVVTVMQAPTGVQVQRGVTLRLGDAGQPRLMPFASCEPQNCEVSQILDDATVRELVAAPQATATIYAKDGRGIQFSMPLKGIDRALGAVRS